MVVCKDYFPLQRTFHYWFKPCQKYAKHCIWCSPTKWFHGPQKLKERMCHLTTNLVKCAH
jgi:hypothetical protein